MPLVHTTKSLVPLLLAPLLLGCLEPKEKKPEPETHLKKMSREILDLNVVRKDHPDWVEIDPQFQASDPISTSLSASKSIPWDMAKLTFQQWVTMYKVQNDDKLPPYTAVKNYVEKESNGLPGRRFYEHYAYDESSGEIVIMLDKEARNEEFERRGIEIPADE